MSKFFVAIFITLICVIFFMYLSSHTNENFSQPQNNTCPKGTFLNTGIINSEYNKPSVCNANTTIINTPCNNTNVTGLVPISANGKSLAEYLDSFDVINLWQPGYYIDWFSGQTINSSQKCLPNQLETDNQTHCSAFVASVLTKQQIPIPNPGPNQNKSLCHQQSLLANSQYDWLMQNNQIWTLLKSPVDAQNRANQGFFVVVSYKNKDPSQPGHIAIVMPYNSFGLNCINLYGPQIIQAGTTNYQSTTVAIGFNCHYGAWPYSNTSAQFFVYNQRPYDATKTTNILNYNGNKC